MSEANAQYRDSVFRSYFNEPTRLLSLCNAVLGTNYDNPAELEINTLEGIFLSRQKNDISCAIDNNFLVLVEHQSSVNNNMPFRFLSYVAELLNNLITDKRKLYKEELIRFPAPKFFVLYDGDKAEPVKKIMRLSDAFGGDSSSLELLVTAYNINRAVNAPLLDKCPYLRDYSTLVGEVKDKLAQGLSRRNAIIRAVKFCLDNGIMSDYLAKHAEEAFHMLALEWNLDDAKQAWFEEGLERGIEQGIERGIKQGIEQGLERGLEQGIKQGLEQGIEQGLEQGRDEEREAVAAKLIRMGLQFDDIQRATDLPLQRIQELADDNRDR